MTVSATRITAGIFRNRSLVSPQNSATHPMGDRVRQALFNRLGPDFWSGPAEASVSAASSPVQSSASTPVGRFVLDAYAGTGALGLEALSRGAAHVDFVEKDRRAIAALRQNLQALRLGPAEASVYQLSVAQYNELPPTHRLVTVTSDDSDDSSDPSDSGNPDDSDGATRDGYDLIFIDPPYDHLRPAEFAHLAQLLAPTADARLVLSHPQNFAPEEFLTSVASAANAPLANTPPANTPLAGHLSAPRIALRLLSTRSYAAAHISIFAVK